MSFILNLWKKLGLWQKKHLILYVVILVSICIAATVIKPLIDMVPCFKARHVSNSTIYCCKLNELSIVWKHNEEDTKVRWHSQYVYTHFRVYSESLCLCKLYQWCACMSHRKKYIMHFHVRYYTMIKTGMVDIARQLNDTAMLSQLFLHFNSRLQFSSQIVWLFSRKLYSTFWEIAMLTNNSH